MQSIDIHNIVERIAGDGMSLNAAERTEPAKRMTASAVSDSKLTVRRNPSSATANNQPRKSTTTIGGQQQPHRNYTFSAMQLRDIERQNHILVQRIVNTKASASVQQSFSCTNLQQQRRPAIVPSALVNRRRQQQQIDSGNMRLQRRLMEIANKKSSTAGRPAMMR